MSLKPKARTLSQPAVVTANRLIDGKVVWRREGGGWTEFCAEAEIVRGDTLAAALADAARDERRNSVVGAYATDVVEGAPTPSPALMRERIRAEGPSPDVLPRGAATPHAGRR